MRRKNKSFAEALSHASHGLFIGFVYEANIRRQLFILLVAVGLGLYFQISLGEWVVIGLLTVFVLTLELINSAIEALADAVHPDYSEHIERSKDLSAAAVLVASLTATVVGVFIFLPPLLLLVW
jgi:diacylglycerol kinase